MNIFTNFFLKCDKPKEDEFEKDFNRTHRQLPIEIPQTPIQNRNLTGNNRNRYIFILMGNPVEQYLSIIDSLTKKNPLTSGMIENCKKQTKTEIIQYKKNNETGKAQELETNLLRLEKLDLQKEHSITTFLHDSIEYLVTKGKIKQANVLAKKINVLDDFEKICTPKIINFVYSNNMEKAKELFKLLSKKNQAKIIDIFLNVQISKNKTFNTETLLFKNMRILLKNSSDIKLNNSFNCFYIYEFLKKKYSNEINNLKEKIKSTEKNIEKTEKEIQKNKKETYNINLEILNTNNKILDIEKKTKDLENQKQKTIKNMLFAEKTNNYCNKAKITSSEDPLLDFTTYASDTITEEIYIKEELDSNLKKLKLDLLNLQEDSKNLNEKLRIQTENSEKLEKKLETLKQNLKTSNERLKNSESDFAIKLSYLNKLLK